MSQEHRVAYRTFCDRLEEGYEYTFERYKVKVDYCYQPTNLYLRWI